MPSGARTPERRGGACRRPLGAEIRAGTSPAATERVRHLPRRWLGAAVLAWAALGLLGCAGGSAAAPSAAKQAAPASASGQVAGASAATAADRVLYIGGIPDQSTATLTRAFEGFARYLSGRTGLIVKYAPAADYAAIVTAFKRGDVHLVWFGGLTGVQAQAAVPGSEALAQRPRDAEFHSKFIVQAGLPAQKLTDLKGLTFTFGSESSTSGHLMPRYFLRQAGIDPDKDFKGKPNFSGSHDKTWKLVETGAFQAGALNEAVWESALKDNKVDQTKVREFYTTPPYYDYHWAVRGDVDQVFGAATKEKLRQALLGMRPEHGPEAQEALKLFATDRFIETKNENYEGIRQVALQLGILR
ncbi:MAG: putative selenate ABC transporter substrate-binding protein [Chloroflexi bacterium]|nr:putative selenate ABC transporter substrate-binding protein [Chloroflexota bacterium]